MSIAWVYTHSNLSGEGLLTNITMKSATRIILLSAFIGGMILVLSTQPSHTETRSTATSTQEVIIKGEFEEAVRKYKESPEGEEVLNTWATQKAIEEQRAKLDAVEKQMLSKEASL
jgi:hypothetical protein